MVGRSERELEVLNEKLSAELNEKTALASKLTEQLHCSHTELNQLKSELAKVSDPVFALTFYSEVIFIFVSIWILPSHRVCNPACLVPVQNHNKFKGLRYEGHLA